MFRRKRNIQNDTLFLLAGAAVGSLLALLYAPKKGEDLRKDIKNEVDKAVGQVKETAAVLKQSAAVTANGMVNRAGEILSLSRQYVEGSYQTTAGVIQHEISTLRRALNTAVEAYRNYREIPVNIKQRRIDRVFTTADIDFSEEALPKYEGMGRRQE